MTVPATAGPHMLSAALFYAGAGIPVFPVNDQKEPLTGKGGFHLASTDRAQVEEWWTAHPQAGIATPAFDVVDVDLYKPECEPTWKQIAPLIPEGTPQSKTTRGGLQFFFKAGTLADGKIGPGVDCRYASRNYVLLDPSQALGGRYEWVNGVSVVTRKPKPAPEFPRQSARSEFGHLLAQMTAGEKIADGRNKAAWWRAVEILRTLPPDADPGAVVALVHDWVEKHCEGDLSEVDVPKQVRGAVKFVAGERAARPAQDTANTEAQRITWGRLSAVEMRLVRFRDKPLLQADAYHQLVGRKGVGKGTVLASFAARVTSGELGEKSGVVWIASEDSAAIDIKPRLLAAGGDPERVLVVESGWIQLPRDVPEIERGFSELGEVGMLVIDPVGNHITGKSSNSETDIRDAISGLNRIADEQQAMVFGVRHLTEKECSRGVLAAILGSSAWVQVPRAVLAIVRDDEAPDVSHIQCVAGNRLPAGTPGRAFRMEGVLLPGLENEVTRAAWLGDSTKDVEVMLSAQPQRPSRSEGARELILDILEREGEQESDGLDARVARETGLKAGTVRQLRGDLKNEGVIKAFPVKDEYGEIERWMVARTQAPRDRDARSASSSTRRSRG